MLFRRDARISEEKRKDFRIVALHTERSILFSRFEMWVAVRLYVEIVVSHPDPAWMILLRLGGSSA